LKFAFDGDLAGALTWEAERRGITPQELAEKLLMTICEEILEAYRATAGPPAQARGQKSSQGPSVESVLKLSYGPSNGRALGRRRGTTTSSDS